MWEGEDAPSITLTAEAAEGDGHGAGSGTDADTAGDVSADAVSTEGSIDLVARIMGVVGVMIGIAGITAAVLTRRSVRTTR